MFPRALFFCVVFMAVTARGVEPGAAEAKSGDAKIDAGDLTGAIADYTEAIKAAPKNPAYLIVRGKLYFIQQKKNEAVADFYKAYEMDRTNVGCCLNLATALNGVGKYEEAFFICKWTLERDPKSAEAYALRAEAWAGLRNPTKAMADATRALELDPNNTGALAIRCFLLLDKDPKAMAEDAGRLVTLMPNNESGYRYRGQVRMKSGDYDGAMADFNRAISIAPKYAENYILRGGAEMKKGDYDAAEADVTKAIEIDPGDSVNYYVRAMVRDKKGDVTGAEADRKKQKELEAKDEAEGKK